MSRNNNDPFGRKNYVDENAAAIYQYVKERRNRAGNPQKKWDGGLFNSHQKARKVAFNTRKMYELEKNAAKKEALLKNAEKAEAELNALANAINANSNADYPFLEEYEDMVNRGEGEVVPVNSINHIKKLLAFRKKYSKERASRSNSVRANVTKRAQLESSWANSTPNAGIGGGVGVGGGGGSQRKSRKSKGRKSRKSKTRRY
jgi:hypothetical protein